MIVSTGMANLEEISDAVAAARQAGCKDLASLHCVSGYPAPADEYNLSTIEKLRSEFGCVVGLSDHTLDNVTAISRLDMVRLLSRNILRWTVREGQTTIFSSPGILSVSAVT